MAPPIYNGENRQRIYIGDGTATPKNVTIYRGLGTDTPELVYTAARLILATMTQRTFYEVNPDDATDTTTLRVIDLDDDVFDIRASTVYQGRYLIAGLDETSLTNTLVELDLYGTAITILRNDIPYLIGGIANFIQAMTVYNNLVVIVGRTGGTTRLWSLDPDSTEAPLERRTFTVGSAMTSATIHNGRFIATTNTGDLYEFDPFGTDTPVLLRSFLGLGGLNVVGPITSLSGRMFGIVREQHPAIERHALYEIDPDGANDQGTLLRQLPDTDNSGYGGITIYPTGPR